MPPPRRVDFTDYVPEPDFLPYKETRVSKSSDQPEAAPAESTPAAPQPQRQQVHVDDSKAVAAYANFCRVTGTPEELIIDFGLNPQPFGVPQEPVSVTQRIVTNYYTAKRMLHALTLTVQRHEQAFGVLETDVQKRVVPSVRAQMAAASGQK
jgi:hypothetical protein